MAHASLSPMSTGWARRNLRRDVRRVGRDLRALYWEQVSPASVTYRGVRLDLRGAWATPQLRDAIYNLVARNRYRIFGKYDACFVPDEAMRARVIE